MQHSHTISITPQFISTLTGHSIDRLTLINNELNAHQADISSLLSSYHWHEKGVVEQLRIDPSSIAIGKNGTGSFKVAYAINIHYGCSDIDIDMDKSMLINTILDISTSKLFLTGEYIPEREPDEF